MRHLSEKSVKLIDKRLVGEEEVCAILMAIGNRIGFLKGSSFPAKEDRINELKSLEEQIHYMREPLEVPK